MTVRQERVTEDEKLQRILESEEPLMRACVGIASGARLIEPFEPEMAADVSARFRELVDQVKKKNRQGVLDGLTDLRDLLVVIAVSIHTHAIDGPKITTDQLVDGFFSLMDDLEEWAKPVGLKPLRERTGN